MQADPPVVISASRRTDIPSFYMPWLMAQLEHGFVETVNPYNRYRKRVPATPDAVHSIVFWSKNYGPFLKGRYGEKLQGQRIPALFSLYRKQLPRSIGRWCAGFNPSGWIKRRNCAIDLARKRSLGGLIRFFFIVAMVKVRSFTI